MTLNLPNDILNDTDVDAVPVQQNFQLIETHINSEVIDRSGSVAMVNALLLPGVPTATNHAATKGYVDTQVATQLSQAEADARYVNLTGDTMSGPLVLQDAPSATSHATRKDYVDAQVATRLTQAQVDARVTAVGDPRYLNATSNDSMPDGRLYIGVPLSGDANSVGVFLVGDNGGNNYVQATSNQANIPCLVGNKVGAGIAADHDYAHFRTNNGTIGSITRNGSASGVKYNTTSDYRLKDDHGPISDGLARLSQLIPRRVVWKVDPTQTEVDGFFAHEVQAVVPDAVTGTKDAVATETDEAAGLAQGQMIAQQLDLSKLVPVLVSAVQELAQRVVALEG